MLPKVAAARSTRTNFSPRRTGNKQSRNFENSHKGLSFVIFMSDSDVSFCFCRWTPYGTATTKCTICKQQVHQDGKYCHTCAYSKGNNITYLSVILPLVRLAINKLIELVALRSWFCRSVCHVREASVGHQDV